MALDGSASCASSARAKRRLAVDLLIRVAIAPGHDGAPHRPAPDNLQRPGERGGHGRGRQSPPCVAVRRCQSMIVTPSPPMVDVAPPLPSRLTDVHATQERHDTQPVDALLTGRPRHSEGEKAISPLSVASRTMKVVTNSSPRSTVSSTSTRQSGHSGASPEYCCPVALVRWSWVMMPRNPPPPLPTRLSGRRGCSVFLLEVR